MAVFSNNTVPNTSYSIDSEGHIRPASPSHGMAWWKDEKTFSDAIDSIVASEYFQGFQEEAIPNEAMKNQPEEWEGWLRIIKANGYLDIEEGFFLATGVIVPNACVSFQWNGGCYYTIRPDLMYLGLCYSDYIGDIAINKAEEVVCERLDEICPMEIYAIQRAIQAGEIDPRKLYPVQWWRDFWKVRELTIVFDKTAVSKVGKPESTRKTENLLRAIASIAIDAYGHDPKSAKSSAPQDIADALDKQGFPLDPKTIRGWLKDGSDLLQPNKPK